MTYFNTTKETGPELKKNQGKAKSQNEQIMSLFESGAKLSPSLILPRMNCPITSIRRALNTLENQNKIRRINVKVFGLYGRKEYMYKKI